MYSSLLTNYINQKPAYNTANTALHSLAGNTVNKPALNRYMPSSAPVAINNEPHDELKKKEKKKKIAKIALTSAAIFTVTMGAIAAFRHNGGLIKSVKDFVKNLKHKAPSAPQGDFSAENLMEFQKGADNINSAKDVASRHLLLKIPGYSRFDKFVSEKYKATALSATTKGWTKAKKGFIKTRDKIFGALNETQDFDETKASRIKELLQKRMDFINTASDPNEIKTRFNTVDRSLTRLDKDAWQTILKAKDEGFEGIKKLSKEALAEDRLNKAKNAQNQILGPLLNSDLSTDEAKELKELLLELKDKSKTSFMSDFISSNWQFKHAKNKESRDLFDKLRDINYGCAPTDIINMGLTTGMLGIYTAQADSKEERVGVTLTTGIPLIVTLATTIFATNKMVSGAKAMLMGLATGFAANQIGKKANEKYKEKNNIQETPKTIVDFNDYMNTIKDAGENILTSI